jgi:DNA-directed RNA polymerase subunit K
MFLNGSRIDGSTIHKSWLISLNYTRFEKARIIGARALQISMGAPSLISLPKDVIFPIDIAMLEFKEKAIPITVKRDETP